MRFIFGVLLPLLLQTPVCVWLIFGDVVKVRGGSFVPLGAMLLAPVLVLASAIYNHGQAMRQPDSPAAPAWLFMRGTAVALSVPLLLALIMILGSALLD